jgi:hypothetical protein
MKKKLLFGCLVSSLASFAQSPAPSVGQTRNSELLKNYSEFILGKSTADFIPGYMEESYYNSGVWDLSGRNEYTYVGSNRVATDTYFYFDGVDFVLSSRVRNTYDPTFEVRNYEWWDMGPGDWVDSWVDSTFFDANGNVIKQVGYSYDQMTSSWQFEWGLQTVYTYSAANEILSATYSSLDALGIGTLSYREMWTWTGGNGPSAGLFQEWNTSTSAWVDEMRATGITWFDFSQFMVTAATLEEWSGTNWEYAVQLEAAFFPNGVAEYEIYRMWDGSAFVNVEKGEQTIDANGQVTSYSSFEWDDVANDWEFYFGIQYDNTYAANDALLQIIDNVYDDVTSTFNPYYRRVYGDHINVASLVEFEKLSATIYPNPVNDRLNVKLDGKATHFEVMNLAGQSLIVGLASDIMTIDVAELAQGMYVLKISNGKQSNAIKFVKK